MGIDTRQVEFFPNVSRTERASYEQEAREFYAAEYPDFNYTGFRGFEGEATPTSQSFVQPRSEQDFYFPAHYIEPVPGSEMAIDIDGFSSGFFRPVLQDALDTLAPKMSGRIQLFEEEQQGLYAVFLIHPGIEVSTIFPEASSSGPRGISMLVIRVVDLLDRATKNVDRKTGVRIYDITPPFGQPAAGAVSADPEFLGGLIVDRQHDMVRPLKEQDMARTKKHRYTYEETMTMANREWLVVMCNTDDEYEPNLLFLILGGVSIFVASACAAMSLYACLTRENKLNQVRSAAAAERAALILTNAKEAATRERMLNDFIAHE